MSCEWGYTDCTNLDKKCHLCFTSGQHYTPVEIKKPKSMAKRQQKADKRMGGNFEFRNHQNNEALLNDTFTAMTPNSGAGSIKGDERIRGLVNIMEELKTKVVKQAPGKESFTIKREWLDKLNREARQANEDFWYLKFSFNEYSKDIFVIVEQDIIMSMVATIVEDRKQANIFKSKEKVLKKRIALLEAENIKLIAEKDLIEAKYDLVRKEHDIEEA